MGFFQSLPNAKTIKAVAPVCLALIGLIIGTAIISVHCTQRPIQVESNLDCYNCTCQTCPGDWQWFAHGDWIIESNSSALWSWNSSGRIWINGQQEANYGSLFASSLILESKNTWTALTAEPLITCPMPHAWTSAALTSFFALLAALFFPFKPWKVWESLICALFLLGSLITILIEFYILQEPGKLVGLGVEWSFNKAAALCLGIAWSHLLRPRIKQSIPIGCLALVSTLSMLLGSLAPPELALALIGAGASTCSALLWKAEPVAQAVHLQLIGLTLLIFWQGYPILAIAGALSARLYKLPGLYSLGGAVVASVAAFLLSDPVDTFLIGWAIAIAS